MNVQKRLAAALCAGALSPAWAAMPAQDTVKGASDHPLLSRFSGSKMVGYGIKQYEEVVLPAGVRVADRNGKPAFDKELRLEGKYTRIAYNYPKDRSSLEVMRNYQAALDKAGIKPLFSCSADACGNDFGDFFLNRRVGDNFIQGDSAYWEPFNYGRDHERYLLAKGVRPDGSPVHVAVYVVDPVEDKNGGVYLDIVEGKAMETGKVASSPNAGDMAKGIANEGKIAVYGIYFDTNKADIKPESKTALQEMAKMLQQNGALKVYVVGHTDNQGAYAANLDLSQKRADSVVKALAGEYHIDPHRLLAKGVASLAPVASNDAETGRNKNRRVELVKQ
ncbi:MAG: OmpA family protein [Gammaproteobacteria bacterium]